MNRLLPGQVSLASADAEERPVMQPPTYRPDFLSRNRGLVIIGAIIAGCLFIWALLGIAASSFTDSSGPGFTCAISTVSAGTWDADVTVTGPTDPGLPLMNVSIVYYDQAGNEIGSDGITPIGPFGGIVVPAGQSVTYNGVDSGSGPVPASCQATEGP
jgi:hypothetical protein